MKKQRKSKASARKKKRQRNRNKRAREKGKAIDKPKYSEGNTADKTNEPEQKKDSLHYSFTSPEEDQYIIIKFLKAEAGKKDSILVKYPDRGDEISGYDKQTLKNYLDSNKVDKITLIQVREHIGTKEEDKRHNKHTTPVKRNISNYFIQLGVPPEKISFK